VVIDSNSVLNDVAQTYYEQQLNAVFAATNGGQLTVTRRRFGSRCSTRVKNTTTSLTRSPATR